MTENKIKVIFLGLAAVFSFVARLLPHLPNFAPIGALAIMAGTYLPRKYALLLPLTVMLASDYFIGFYDIKIMLAVYLSFLLYVLLGNIFGRDRKVGKLTGGAFLGSLLFFLITNFAVFAFTSMYSKDFSGLMMSYTLALPFFKNTLLADLFYTAAFFAAYELALKKITLRKPILPAFVKLAKPGSEFLTGRSPI